VYVFLTISDNTYPNVAAALTGQSAQELSDTCLKHKPGVSYFDDCPHAWKNFSDRGYITVFGEDAPWMGAFNYLKKGFKSQPTDYYFRTLASPLESKLGTATFGSAATCYGPRLAFKLLLDYMKRISTVIDSKQRLFEFIWSSSLFHDSARLPMIGDAALQQFLIWMKSSGKLEHTALILMSDHGMRFGALRSTYQGKIEDRLPFVHFVFPEWFRAKYPMAIANMEANKRKLTTPFDLHATLLDLAELENISDETIRERMATASEWSGSDIPRGISLFVPIPSFRDCTMAGIPYQWCMCLQKREIQNDSLEAMEAGAALVQLINDKVSEFAQCAFVTLKKLVLVERVVLPEKYYRKKRMEVFDVKIVASPADASFESTILKSRQGKWSLSGSLSRTNKYGNQSYCVEDSEAKKYCFCYDQYLVNKTGVEES